MTRNGRHTTGIFPRFIPRHSRCIPRYENSRSDQKKPGKLYIIPGQTRKIYAPAQFFDQKYFPVVSLIVSAAAAAATGMSQDPSTSKLRKFTPSDFDHLQTPWFTHEISDEDSDIDEEPDEEPDVDEGLDLEQMSLVD